MAIYIEQFFFYSIFTWYQNSVSASECISSFQYYLIILDDYTHYVGTFPIRHKSKVPTILRHFYNYVRNQFHLSIQSIQCGNGREFDNHALRSFLSDHGVTLRLSCPYTSSQNGKAERSIRTVNDILHTLLEQASMPRSYWVEALHTATYVLNRRPCQPLQFRTPYQLLFGCLPDYQHLRTFGCLCYPNLSSITTHKLSPHSARCVF
jgi:transposase InsO family protein